MLPPKKGIYLNYSEMALLRSPFGLPKSGVIGELYLIWNHNIIRRVPLGTGKDQSYSEVVLILGGLISEILFARGNIEISVLRF